MKLHISLLCSALAAFFAASPPVAYCKAVKLPGKYYKDSRGKKVYLPLGDLSFADEVVSYKVGKPAPKKPWMVTERILGVTDYVSHSSDQKDPKCLTLGGRGSITLKFTDNVLVDGPGADLYVWEVGPAVEPTQLEISEDGKNWINVGKIKGATASVDISGYVKPGAVFRYVRLTDLGKAASGRWPGADIDAVAAIGSGYQISLSGEVLFDFDKATLKPGAKAELNKVAARIKSVKNPLVTIEGHTDSKGTDQYNKKLSKERAESVRNYFIKQIGLKSSDTNAIGYGESRPVATNETDEGRAKNRRVEIVIRPSR